MRVLEHRRHSRRDPTSPHLSAAGIELARRVGRTLGKFDRVVTSPKPRAVETAIEMGLWVDEEIEELATMPDDAGFPGDPTQLRSFSEYLGVYRQSKATARYAREQETVWLRELLSLPEGGRLLLISHGGLIECGTVAALGEMVATWGEVLGPLEGVRMYREGTRWTRGEVLRVLR